MKMKEGPQKTLATTSEGSAASVNRGKIQVAPNAIATIASRAAFQCYGVVGMASRNFAGIPELLHQNERHRGVHVGYIDGEITIDLYVIIEYGVRISEVAHQMMASVKFAVERAVGVTVRQVNVNVQGLRISNETKEPK